MIRTLLLLLLLQGTGEQTPAPGAALDAALDEIRQRIAEVVLDPGSLDLLTHRVDDLQTQLDELGAAPDPAIIAELTTRLDELQAQLDTMTGSGGELELEGVQLEIETLTAALGLLGTRVDELELELDEALYGETSNPIEMENLKKWDAFLWARVALIEKHVEPAISFCWDTGGEPELDDQGAFACECPPRSKWSAGVGCSVETPEVPDPK